MIRSNEEEALRRKGLKQFEELQNPLDQAIIGSPSKHLVIPVMDIYNMRRVAGILHGLAADLDQFSRRQDLPPRTIVLCVQDAVNLANEEIRRMTGKGKRKRTYGGTNPRAEGEPPDPYKG